MRAIRIGGPPSVAVKIAGHRTETIYRRYAIVPEADIAEGLGKLASFLEDEGRRAGGATHAEPANGFSLPVNGATRENSLKGVSLMEVMFWVLCLAATAGLIGLACLLLCVRAGLENFGCVAPIVGAGFGFVLGNVGFISGWTGPDPLAFLILMPIGALFGALFAAATASMILLARALAGLSVDGR